jgi:hypothetical protein
MPIINFFMLERLSVQAGQRSSFGRIRRRMMKLLNFFVRGCTIQIRLPVVVHRGWPAPPPFGKSQLDPHQ